MKRDELRTMAGHPTIRTTTYSGLLPATGPQIDRDAPEAQQLAECFEPPVRIDRAALDMAMDAYEAEMGHLEPLAFESATRLYLESARANRCAPEGPSSVKEWE